MRDTTINRLEMYRKLKRCMVPIWAVKWCKYAILEVDDRCSVRAQLYSLSTGLIDIMKIK